MNLYRVTSKTEPPSTSVLLRDTSAVEKRQRTGDRQGWLTSLHQTCHTLHSSSCAKYVLTQILTNQKTTFTNSCYHSFESKHLIWSWINHETSPTYSFGLWAQMINANKNIPLRTNVSTDITLQVISEPQCLATVSGDYHLGCSD